METWDLDFRIPRSQIEWVSRKLPKNIWFLKNIRFVYKNETGFQNTVFWCFSSSHQSLICLNTYLHLSNRQILKYFDIFLFSYKKILKFLKFNLHRWFKIFFSLNTLKFFDFYQKRLNWIFFAFSLENGATATEAWANFLKSFVQ